MITTKNSIPAHVSIKALLNDPRLVAAHEKAVAQAIAFIKSYKEERSHDANKSR